MDTNVVLCTLLLFGAAFAKDKVSVVTDKSDEWNLDQCRKSYEEQSKAILKLQDAMAKQDERISKIQNNIEDEMSKQADIISHNQNQTKDAMSKQDELIFKTQHKNEKLSNEVESLKQYVHSRPDIRYDLNGTGCFMDVITMNCVGNGTLSITNAIYGKYASSCIGCCSPSADDCTVLMSDHSPTEWAALLAQCNGQTGCSHQYEGEIINDCELGYMADYMQISYTCPPDNVVLNDAIGFTAIHSADADYFSGDIVRFDNVVTNIGNHYDFSNYTFTCPIKGMYLFSVSVLSNTYEYDSDLAIMRDDVVLIDVYLHASSSDYILSSASAFIIVECDIGQHVYVEATSTAHINGRYESSHLSGALIQRL